MSLVNIIAAKSLNNVIGKDGKIPWDSPEDMAYFKELTQDSTVIMGRRTWESLPGKLSNRENIVISSNLIKGPDLVVTSLAAAIKHASKQTIFIIGGAELYEEALLIADYLYLNVIKQTVEDGDTFFPEINQADWELDYAVNSGSRSVLFKKYRRK